MTTPNDQDAFTEGGAETPAGPPELPGPPGDPPRWVSSRELTSSLAMEFRCPACGQRVRTQKRHIGKPGRCPACKQVFLIPRRPRRTCLQW